MPPLILGIDIGTTSVSAVAISETGQLIATATSAHLADVDGLPDGYHEQNPDQLWDCVKTVVRQVVEKVPRHNVLAIGVYGANAQHVVA